MSVLARMYGYPSEATEDNKNLSEQLSQSQVISDYPIDISSRIKDGSFSDILDSSNTSNTQQNL